MNKYLILLMIGMMPEIYALSGDQTAGIAECGNDMFISKSKFLYECNNTDEIILELKTARRNGNVKYASAISQSLHKWWMEYRKSIRHPATKGSNPSPSADMYDESHVLQKSEDSRWGYGVLIDGNREDVYDVKIASLSNGELYAISIWDSLGNDHILIHRSTDAGWHWQVYWNCDFRNDYKVYYPGIRIVNDTILMWYVIRRITDDASRTWVRTCLPGNSDNCIFYGSPTGGFNAIRYSCLDLTDDSPIYSTNEYIYATWIETYGIGPDSTRVMFARSDENDVRFWELEPTALYSTHGANVYFFGTKIAYGSASDMMWLTAWLHPSGYPSVHDRNIWGWYSVDYGGTWSAEHMITPVDNKKDEYAQTIAGSHSNSNWILAYTQVDTNYTGNRDICYSYSTNDSTWATNSWVTSYDEFLPDIYVDNASTAFYLTYRQDGGASEYIFYREGNITNPNTWSQITLVNSWGNLSGIYCPSISRNIENGDVIIAWTACEGLVYRTWFNSESWYKITENHMQDSKSSLDIHPNPFSKIIEIEYQIPLEYQNADQKISLKIYNISGQMVKSFNHTSGQLFTRLTWFGDDNTGHKLSAGIYFINLTVDDEKQVKKVVLLN